MFVDTRADSGPRVVEERLAVPTDDGIQVDVWRSFDATRTHPGAAAVIVCHGFVQNRLAFQCHRRSMLAHLRELGLVVYVLELRGRQEGGPSAAGLADYIELDAAAVVRAVRAQHSSVAWIGHSMGGLVGALLHADAADSLDALVTIGTPLLPGPARFHSKRALRAVVRAARLVHDTGLQFAGPRWGAGLHALRLPLDHPRIPALLRIWAPRTLDEVSLTEALTGSFAHDSWAVLADLLELVVTNGTRAGSIDVSARLSQLRRPLFVVAGDADDLAPPSGARPLFERAGSIDKEYLEVGTRQGARAGHIDLLIGEAAPRLVWAPLASFLRRHLREAR